MKLKEQMAISEHVAKKIQAEARMFKFGAITDKNLGESLRVTIIAAGFDGTNALMEQLKSPVEPEAEEAIVPEEVDELGTTVEDALAQDQALPVDELEPVEAEAEVAAPEPVTMTAKVDERQLTPTSLNGTTIIRPEPINGFHPTHDDGGTLVLDDEERYDDAELIRRTIDTFMKGQYSASDLDRPTFERNKTVLYQMPMLPENEFVRSKLND